MRIATNIEHNGTTVEIVIEKEIDVDVEETTNHAGEVIASYSSPSEDEQYAEMAHMAHSASIALMAAYWGVTEEEG